MDPACLVGLKLSPHDKYLILKLDPCQPSESILKQRKRQIGQSERCCSQGIFDHEYSRRRWVSYSLSEDKIFCIPCLLFTDAALRGEHTNLCRVGSSFATKGFGNWKKQFQAVKTHEQSEVHRNAKIAETRFKINKDIDSYLHKQEENCDKERKKKRQSK